MIEVVKPQWQAPAGIHACCSTRLGGVSQAPYQQLNLGLHVGDRADDVMRNRQQLRQTLALPGEPGWINQSHSARVVTLEQDDSRDADAAITRQSGSVAVVMTADCLPILLCNHAASEVAAIHAGWRGLQRGIIQATIAAMQSSPQQLMAWIGPGISQPCYEVGAEVYAAFIDTVVEAESCFQPSRPEHWLCDLGGLAASVLNESGISDVTRSPHCSFRDDRLFYSYRREAVTGRMASLIWIN